MLVLLVAAVVVALGHLWSFPKMRRNHRNIGRRDRPIYGKQSLPGCRKIPACGPGGMAVRRTLQASSEGGGSACAAKVCSELLQSFLAPAKPCGCSLALAEELAEISPSSLPMRFSKARRQEPALLFCCLKTAISFRFWERSHKLSDSCLDGCRAVPRTSTLQTK